MIEIKDLLHIESDQLCHEISELSHLAHYEKKSVIQEIGTKQDAVRVLIDGVVRCYYFDAFKEEHTMGFMETPGDAVMVGNDRALAMHGYEAVTDVTLLELPMECMPALLRDHPEMQMLFVAVMEHWLSYHAEVSMLLRGANPAAKWSWFCRRCPKTLKCASQKHIASFLGITPETLSRVKKRNAAENACDGTAVIYEKNIAFDGKENIKR